MEYTNPYLNRNALRANSEHVFVGRVSEKRAILSRIYAGQPQSVEIIGERRIGKSSLLYAVQNSIRADARDDVVHVLIDAQIFAQGDPCSFFAEVLGQIRNRKSTGVTFENTYQGFAAMIKELERNDLRLVLLIDEFDVITNNQNFTVEFFNFLRAQANNHQVAYILSSVTELDKVCHSEEVAGSPFFNIFYRLYLGPLLRNDALELISKPSAKAGFDLSRFAEWIVDISGYFPFLLQITCSRIFEWNLANSTLDIDRILLRNEIAHDFQPHLDYMWRTLNEQFRDVLITSATGSQVDESHYPVVSILARKGYITQQEDAFRLSSSLLREFILEKSGRLSEKSMIVYVELDTATDKTTNERILDYIARNEGATLSVNSGIAASFRNFEFGINACTSIRDLLSAINVPFKLVTVSYSEAEGFANTRSLCKELINGTDIGEIAATAKVVSKLPKPLIRKFRKLGEDRRSHDLPKLYVMSSRALPQAEPQFFGRPGPKQNNLWYEYRDPSTVLVFVHGIFSDSASCWLNKVNDSFWPDLVRSDSRLEHPSIYLGGYFTDISSDIYDLDNCEHELFSALNRPSPDSSTPSPMQLQNIVFICHSTGGIVVRYMLERQHEHFTAKRVGLMLVASPSYGSSLANRLDWLAKFYKNQLGQQLKWGSWSLQDLDSRFKSLVHDRKIPGLVGIEAYENKFVVSRRFWPNTTYVVNEESAGRYFGPPVLLRNTDHFSSVKPDNINHPVHETLVDFYLRQFKRRANTSAPKNDSDLLRNVKAHARLA